MYAGKKAKPESTQALLEYVKQQLAALNDIPSHLLLQGYLPWGQLVLPSQTPQKRK